MLKVEGVHSGYGNGDILQGVTLGIAPGEIVATIGRNGVGKSTLMKSIIGIVRPTRGSIRFNDHEIARMRGEKRAWLGIGYVPQGREIFPELTVGENLMMGETINRSSKVNRYELVFAYFPVLEDRRRQLAGTLSGGQQQMLSIGRALVGHPQLLLLDEPSMGIQPSIIQEIGRSLLKLNRDEKLTVLLVEQNMALIEQTAHRAYVMDKGRIVSEIGPHDVRDRNLLSKYLSL
jgi:branched-chain amino acid transport system ATP-binding protein